MRYTHFRRFVLALIVVAPVVFFFSICSKVASSEAPVFAPSITATKSVAEISGTFDGNADPGDVLEYTIIVTNGGPDPATGLQVADQLAGPQTLVGASLLVSPIAVNDAYTSIGNVGISVPDGVSDILANDINPNGAGTLTVVAPIPVTSTQGGQVSINTTTGGFTYNPPPGFEGSDTFTYALGNGTGLTNTATVTITVSGMIWFVQTGAAAGDGRLGTPFNCFVGAVCFDDSVLDQAGDNIFLYSGAYTGGQTLLNTQRLIGQGATAALAGPGSITGITIPAFSNTLPTTGGTRPTITTTVAATSAITLGSGNTLRGFNIGNTTAADITGTSFGTLTALEMDLNGTGRPLVLTTGTLAAAFDTLTSTSSAGGAAVSLTTVAGTLTAGSAVLTGGVEGINLNAMSGSVTITTVSINGQSGDGINITNSSGTTTINGGTVGNTDDPGGNAVEVNGNNGNVTIVAALTKTTAGKIVLVTARTGNTVALLGNISATGAVDNGIDVNNNTAGIVTFTGQTQTLTTGAGTGVNLVNNGTGVITFAPTAGGNGLDINTTSGVGLNATGGGTVTVQSTGNTIKTQGGTALNVTNTTIGALGLTFECISAGRDNTGGTACNLGANVAGPAKGIILNTTGSSGGLSVTGTGTTVGSGGTIQGTDTRGAEIISSFNLSLKNMNLTNANDVTDGGAAGVCDDLVAITCNAAVYLRTVTGFATLDNLDITGTMVEHGVVAISVANLTFNNSLVDHAGNDPLENGFTGENLSGTVTVNNTDIAFSEADGLKVINTGTSANVSVSGSSFRDSQTGGPSCPAVCNGEGGFHFRGLGSGTITINLLNSSFLRNNTQGIQVFSGGTATINLDVVGNTIDPGATGVGTGIDINANNSSTLNFNITANPTIQSRGGAAVNITSFLSGHIEGRVNNNPDIEVLSSAGLGIKVTPQETSQAIVLIDNNTVTNVNGTEDTVIDVQARFQTARADATITNNTVTNEVTGIAAINLISGSSTAGETNITCGDIQGNNVPNAVGNTTRAFRVRVSDLSNVNRLYLEGFTTDTATTWINRSNLPAVAAEVAVSLTGTAVAPSAPPGGLCQAVDTPTDFAVVERLDEKEVNNLASIILGTGYEPSNLAEVINNSEGHYLYEILPSKDANISGEEFASENNETIQSGPWPDVNSIFTAADELYDRVSRDLVPTAHAQEPESGETVNVPAFTLPPGELVTVKFRVTVDAAPYDSGVDNITNQATVSGTNFTNVLTNTTSIPLDAEPDLIVTKSDGIGIGTTEPGEMIAYTLTYSNSGVANANGAPQHAGSVVLSETVPLNTTFNAAASTPGWSCPNGSVNPTVCTLNVGAVNAGAAAGSAIFTVNVPALLPVTAVNVTNTSVIAESPADANGTDRDLTTNTSTDADLIRGNWNGSVSTDWNNPANWSNGLLPIAGNNISIPDVANAPAVTIADVTVGLLTLGDNLTIGAGRTVTANDNVTLNDKLVTGLGTLELGVDAGLTRTTGQVESTLKKNFDQPDTFIYHVGTPGEYSPVDVVVTAGTGSLSVLAVDGPVPATTPLSANRLQRYWTLTGTGITADVTFHYLQSDVLGPFEALYRTVRVTGGTATIFPNVCSGANQTCVNATANTIFVGGLTSFSNWSATEVLPTAGEVSVSGRVLNQTGRGISGVRLTLTDAAGNALSVTTNIFGFYRFDEVESGRTYTLTPEHSRFRFTSRVLTVEDNMEGVDFVAELP